MSDYLILAMKNEESFAYLRIHALLIQFDWKSFSRVFFFRSSSKTMKTMSWKAITRLLRAGSQSVLLRVLFGEIAIANESWAWKREFNQIRRSIDYIVYSVQDIVST